MTNMTKIIKMTKILNTRISARYAAFILAPAEGLWPSVTCPLCGWGEKILMEKKKKESMGILRDFFANFVKFCPILLNFSQFW